MRRLIRSRRAATVVVASIVGLAVAAGGTSVNVNASIIIEQVG